MCQAVEEYARECGEINRIEGKIQGRVITYYELGFSVKAISDKMNIPVEQIEAILKSEENN